MPGDTLGASFTVRETQGGQGIQGISIFTSDLGDAHGNIIPAGSVAITPNAFDLLAGESRTVDLTITLDPALPYGSYTGSITVESLNAGTKSVQIEVQVGQRGTIIVEKQTNPDGAAGNFIFSGEAGGRSLTTAQS